MHLERHRTRLEQVPDALVSSIKTAVQTQHPQGLLSGYALESVRRAGGVGHIPNSLALRESVWNVPGLCKAYGGHEPGSVMALDMPQGAGRKGAGVHEGEVRALETQEEAGVWKAHMTKEGRVFYANHEAGIVQWSHPLHDMIPLPAGWERKTDEHGRRYYQKQRDPMLDPAHDVQAGMRRWIHPALSPEYSAEQSELMGLQGRVMRIENLDTTTNLTDPHRWDFFAYRALEERLETYLVPSDYRQMVEAHKAVTPPWPWAGHRTSKASTLLPKHMAGAGWVCLPIRPGDDHVVCHRCGVERVGWQEGDDPYLLHKKLSPECPFEYENADEVLKPFDYKTYVDVGIKDQKPPPSDKPEGAESRDTPLAPQLSAPASSKAGKGSPGSAGRHGWSENR